MTPTRSPDKARPPSGPALRVRGRATGRPLVLRPGLEIGAGGEARVLAHPADARLVAKLYHHPDAAREAKVAAMLAHPPRPAEDAGFRLAWPLEALEDGEGRFRGFVMPRAGGPRVFELYNPVTRRERAPLFHHALLHRAGRNLAMALARLHEAGYVVGDVNESNILVSAHGGVTLVDADSFQVRDAAGAVHRSRVGKAEFTPPELQGRPFGEVDRGPEHDRFGLAVLLFLLLMEGTHPFAGQYPAGGEAPPVEQRIRDGHFPYAGRPGAPSRPARLAPPFGTLHPGLQALFLRAFAEGHDDPALRPPAAEWASALERAEAALVACERNAQHRFGTHLALCPWCERAALLGGRDPFPAREAPGGEGADEAESFTAEEYLAGERGFVGMEEEPLSFARHPVGRGARRRGLRRVLGVTPPPPPPEPVEFPPGIAGMGILGVTAMPRVGTPNPAPRRRPTVGVAAVPASVPLPGLDPDPGPALPSRARRANAWDIGALAMRPEFGHVRDLLALAAPLPAGVAMLVPSTGAVLLCAAALAMVLLLVPDALRGGRRRQLPAVLSLCATLVLVMLSMSVVAERQGAPHAPRDAPGLPTPGPGERMPAPPEGP